MSPTTQPSRNGSRRRCSSNSRIRCPRTRYPTSPPRQTPQHHDTRARCTRRARACGRCRCRFHRHTRDCRCLTWSYAPLDRCDLHSFDTLSGKGSFVGFFSLTGFLSSTMTRNGYHLYMIVMLAKYTCHDLNL